MWDFAASNALSNFVYMNRKVCRNNFVITEWKEKKEMSEMRCCGLNDPKGEDEGDKQDFYFRVPCQCAQRREKKLVSEGVERGYENIEF